MAFKVNVFFTQESELTAGWSMTFWNAASDFATADSRTKSLIAFLDQATSAQAHPVRYRVAEIGSFRRVLVQPYAYLKKTYTIGSAEDGDSVTAALLLQYRKEDATKVYLTRQWLRGVPDKSIQDGGKMTLAGLSKITINLFLKQLTDSTQGWSMWVQDKDQPEVEITGLTTAGIVTAPNHAFAVTSPLTKIRIKNSSKLKALNGIWKVVAVAGSTFQIANWDPTIVIPANVGNPVAIKQVKTLKSIAEAVAVRATKHNTGRPSGTYSGRRKRRAT